MIEILPKQIETYLSLVNDVNPIHQYIAPGQMIVQVALVHNKLNWASYKVNYVEVVEVYEFIKFDFENKNKLVIKNQNDKVKIIVLKNELGAVY
ncbi:hypothetical protein [Staphylococcus nepalensis]|uniref:hypothetical protein n=1 Tax=Staphylococcus nepalensis TaxID=214473 RepID=UPI001A989D1B|nr:hypothetical protein [Staphylococcus nepalensis]MBO1206437.1 hypothetical protein [Staphylococcus nepalensis]